MAQYLSCFLLVAAAGALAGCARYTPQPLPQSPDLQPLQQLRVVANAVAAPRSRRFDVADGLDMAEIAMLAVVNDPDLKAKRAQAGVAGAQLLQAGLLPNPKFSATLLHPTGGPPPLANGYSLGLTQDIRALLTRGPARAAAKAHVKQVDLNILWQEWQVAQHARQLVIKARSQDRLFDLLKQKKRLYARKVARERTALEQGNLTLPRLSGDEVALVDANTQYRQLQRDRNKTRHDLDALLGLKPGVELPLQTDTDDLPVYSAATFHAALARLPQRRPDLIALRAGYQSQEQSVREAVRKQFPALSIGPAGGSDTGNVRTIEFGFALSLPVFNRNQAGIALARATRAKLRAEYQARLDRAANKSHEIWRKIQIIRRQLQRLQARLPKLVNTTRAARAAFRRGGLSAATYTNLRSNVLAKRVEAIRLRASLQQAQVALETLLAMPLANPASRSPDTHT